MTKQTNYQNEIIKLYQKIEGLSNTNYELTEKEISYCNDVLYMCVENNSREVINWLFSNTNYDVWLDKKKFKEKIDNTIAQISNHNPFALKSYDWVMSITPINRLYNDKERGKWLQIGLAMKSFDIIYCASQAGWERDISHDSLFLEIERLLVSHRSEHTIKNLTSDYLDWFTHCFLQNKTYEEKVPFMLPLLIKAFNEYMYFDKLSKLKDIDMLSSNINVSSMHDSVELSKFVINQLQEYICWQDWPIDKKDQFLEILQRNSNSFTRMDVSDMQDFCFNISNELKPVFLSKKLHQTLHNEHNVKSNKKL